ncbi:MAP7 domain-containing protein 2 [Trichomycterus rosablanca]|uniref:MAP7 domain-containing protein 2 n=1 Tax=Trichomycterus rosablanca TaxID=2290929 RepID=UPI002F351FD2
MTSVLEKPANGTLKNKTKSAKEKKEENEKNQAIREQELWEKELRAQKQFERSVEERGRRLEEQRQKEGRRRAAVEERKRQLCEVEKEHLEALMRRSGERGPPLEQRPKRWTWGGPARACEVPDFMKPPGCPDSDLIDCLSSSPSSAALAQTGRASPSPHRSPYKASPSRSERRKTIASSRASEESHGVATTPKTPQAEKQNGEKVFNNTENDSSAKHLESPMTPTKSSKKSGTPKRSKSCKSRLQSPCSPGLFPTSPMRHKAMTPGADSNKRWDIDEKGGEFKGSSTLERKTSRTEKIPKSTSRELESPVTPTGKAGTTDAEEASRLLAEKRRLARVQKEQEEKQRLEEERLRAEELQRKQMEEQERKEQEARRLEEEKQRQEEECRKKEEEDKRQKARRLKDLQDQLDREREEAFQRIQREAERQQQHREQLKLQEEQERLQRKKRIEEIMKRTRKTDTEPKKDELHIEPSSPLIQPVSETLLESRDAAQTNGPSIGISVLKTNEFPSPAGSPMITLEPLEAKCSAADDLSDGVQSMDVSPVSREDLIQEFSPMYESAQALDLLRLTGHAAYPKAGDLNKNLIQSFSSAAADSTLIQSLGPSMDKLTV